MLTSRTQHAIKIAGQNSCENSGPLMPVGLAAPADECKTYKHSPPPSQAQIHRSSLSRLKTSGAALWQERHRAARIAPGVNLCVQSGCRQALGQTGGPDEGETVEHWGAYHGLCQTTARPKGAETALLRKGLLCLVSG